MNIFPRILIFPGFLADIPYRTKPDTIEIYIQGGIDAANGIQSYFKVYPVQMVSAVDKLKRDRKGSGQQDPQTSRPASFQTTRDKTTAEKSPEECYTLTNDRQSRLQT